MNRTTTLTTLALASVLALTGCATGTQQGSGPSAETPAASAAGGGTTSPATGTSPGARESIAAEHNEADVMFAQMMIPHHEQAVEMSEVLLAKDDITAEVRQFAQEVIDAQGPEIERMEQMLSAWGAQRAAPGGGMDHGSGANEGGMMSEQDMAALADAQGVAAARLYLEQMTVHHEGAVAMAQEETSDGRNPQAVQLAQDIIEAQQAEIEKMERMRQQL